MRKNSAIATMLGLILLSLLGGAPVADSPMADTTVADFEASLHALNFTPTPLPHCGDPCFDPGLERGCIDASSGTWKRVQCVCSGGSWLCY